MAGLQAARLHLPRPTTPRPQPGLLPLVSPAASPARDAAPPPPASTTRTQRTMSSYIMAAVRLHQHCRFLGSLFLLTLLLVLLVVSLVAFVRARPCCFQETCSGVALVQGRYLRARCVVQAGAGDDMARWSSLDLDAVVGVRAGGELAYLPS
ncbi:hypothetical protein S40288_10854 [Stachybotrys chartarum IBT 40288]|nr:hypothetical protein S40288_10854 [Stachybotrys chartarum IBT 40288]